ncbi:MAG: serine/threonine protein kinase [Pirellula sp.]|jgi:serine/threonine-protein kinase|nr:serine/threonine protein kinase [Pirellula sp.]
MTEDELARERDRYQQIHKLFLSAVETGPESALEDWVQSQSQYSLSVRSAVVAMLRADSLNPEGAEATKSSQSTSHQRGDFRTVVEDESNSHHPLFDNFEILGEIARGGMGVVYKARQIRPNRIVAIKMIRRHMFSAPSDMERFFLEAEAASQVDSESVVPIFEIGDVQGEPFIVMKYIEGENLEEVFRQGTMDTVTFLKQLITICRAVSVVHDRGIIHRDIKPSNILVDRSTQRFWITDFGIAKYLDRDSKATVAGDLLGTPGYMAPELASVDMGLASRAVDVYGLGAVLYRGLTGLAPIATDSGSLVSLIQKIREHEIVPPRLIQRRIPRSLDTICMKCLETEPLRRYENAGELADDLQRFLDDEPIQARPLGLSRRLVRWARNRPGLAVTWCGLAIFYVYHLICFYSGLYPDAKFHQAATVVTALTAINAYVWQYTLMRTKSAAWVFYVWLTCDLALLTALLFWAASANSSLVLLYHVIVAGSVLRCRKNLVVYVTLAALIGYGIHLTYLNYTQPLELPEIHRTVPTTLSLILIGIIQYFSLLRSATSFEAQRTRGPFR